MPLTLRTIEINAHTAWESGYVRRAFSLFKKGAALGSLGCMLDLGYFYDEGVGTRQDKIKAMFWYKRAYRRGSSAAASNIAILYRERNQARQVFHWFRRAAALGDGDAQVDLAKLFLDGKGVRRSALKAKVSATGILEPVEDRRIGATS